MNAYERYKAGQVKRVKRGVSKMVKVRDLQPGMMLRDHGSAFVRNQEELCSGYLCNVVKMANGYGYVENLDTEVEVTI